MFEKTMLFVYLCGAVIFFLFGVMRAIEGNQIMVMFNGAMCSIYLYLLWGEK